MNAPKTYVEHVAIRVRDIQWHIRFFETVLGMTLREARGPADAPTQCWTHGGIQLIHTPGQAAEPGGALGHIGVMCEDMEATLALARQQGIRTTGAGNNWLQLPDGVVVELIQASPAGSVSQALALNPRVEA
ncbi:2-dehydropantoate 2-reductase OS=Castellaniella defragrans OX=75697 GN=HNR28_003416 PE=3 SV=1 [Castellaniella defragrans]